MPFEKQPLEFVIDILERIVLVGDDFVQDNPPFGLDLSFREGRLRRQFEQQAGRFPANLSKSAFPLRYIRKSEKDFRFL